MLFGSIQRRFIKTLVFNQAPDNPTRLGSVCQSTVGTHLWPPLASPRVDDVDVAAIATPPKRNRSCAFSLVDHRGARITGVVHARTLVATTLRHLPRDVCVSCLRRVVPRTWSHVSSLFRSIAVVLHDGIRLIRGVHLLNPVLCCNWSVTPDFGVCRL